MVGDDEVERLLKQRRKYLYEIFLETPSEYYLIALRQSRTKQRQRQSKDRCMSEILNFGLIITILKDIKHAVNTRPITVSDSKAIVFDRFIMRQIMKEIKRKIKRCSYPY
jgi:hypothetical protein